LPPATVALHQRAANTAQRGTLQNPDSSLSLCALLEQASTRLPALK
jgi:hypothetical protein